MLMRIITKNLNKKKMVRPKLAVVVSFGIILMFFLFSGKPIVSISWDPHEENCLPELHLALLIYNKPNIREIDIGDYVFWKPAGALSYVSEDFVLKKVAGIPGDRLMIKGENVYINGKLIAAGLENAVLYAKMKKDFERDELIPPNSVFVIGTASLSNDSRYWGYISEESIAGKGYRIY